MKKSVNERLVDWFFSPEPPPAWKNVLFALWAFAMLCWLLPIGLLLLITGNGLGRDAD